MGGRRRIKSLHIFGAEAYNVENGVTSDLFPQERDETPGCLFNTTPESGLDFQTGAADDPTIFAAFMALLAPPSRGNINASVTNGAQVFSQVGCGLCHTPSLQTGVNSIAALSQQPVNLYSDLAVHGMGPGLAEGIVQGNAAGDEFRTAPLWGLGQRVFFLHDGRTSNLLEAIRAHASAAAAPIRASEANGVIRRFSQLSTSDQQSLFNFLRSFKARRRKAERRPLTHEEWAPLTSIHDTCTAALCAIRDPLVCQAQQCVAAPAHLNGNFAQGGPAGIYG